MEAFTDSGDAASIRGVILTGADGKEVIAGADISIKRQTIDGSK
jgi:enoyl-CoA hydratase/carnithine racemase